MSGLKPAPMADFYRALHARGATTDTLARDLGVSGGVVRRLLAGHRRRRGPTWQRLATRLTERERALLEDVEQCATWNVRAARRPRWAPEKAAALRRTC